MKQIIRLWLLGCVTWFAAPGVAVAGTTPEPAPASTAADSVTKQGWWTVSLEAANNSSFFGRNAEIKFPYYGATLTYTHRTGLYISGTSYQVFDTKEFDSPDFIDETDLSIGYGFKILKKVDASLSYSRFIFSKNSPLLKSVTNNAATAFAALDWKYIYTGLTTSYIFGRTNDLFVVLDNSRYVALNPIWQGKWPIGIDPKISITAGTQRFSEVYTTTVVEERKNAANGNGNGLLGGILGGGNGKGNGNGNGNNNGTTTTTTTTQHEQEVTRFRVLNYDIKIPVVFSVGNFEFEPTYRYSIPVNLLEGDESRAQSFYSISVGYTF